MLEECTKKIEEMHHAVTNNNVDLRLSSEKINDTNNTHSSTSHNNNNSTSVHNNNNSNIKKEIGHAETKFSNSDDNMQIDGENETNNNNIKNTNSNTSNASNSSEEEKLKQEKLKRDEEAKNYFKNLKVLRQSVIKK
jgi:hypothetical protein